MLYSMAERSLCSTDPIQKGERLLAEPPQLYLGVAVLVPLILLSFFKNSFFFPSFPSSCSFPATTESLCFYCCFLTNRGSSKPKTEHKERPFKQLKTVPEQRQSWIPSPFIHCTFFIKRKHKKKSYRGGEVWWKERERNLKHSESGSVLDVVFFADMLDNKGPKRLLCVPIPFCYHCVTASVSLVLVIFFPLFRCACVILRHAPAPHPFCV